MWSRPPAGAACQDCAHGLPVERRVVLVGDAGEDLPDNPVLRLVKRLGKEAEGRTITLFLGDNIYPRGMPAVREDAAGERADAKRILGHQIGAARAAGAEAIFVPGNHDWNKGAEGGFERVRAQGDFIVAGGDPRIRMQPRNACPGPVIVDRGEALRIVVIDSQWLLTHARQRGEAGCNWGPEGSGEPLDLEGTGFEGGNEVVYTALRAALASAGGRHVIVATHHPLRTHGSHGGHVTAKEFFFPGTLLKKWLFVPLPILYPVLRYGLVRHDQDLVGGRNRAMVAGIEGALAEADAASLAVASGHEHSLQVLEHPTLPLLNLISGAGSKAGGVGKGDDTLFKHGHLGLMVVDVLGDGRALLRVVEPRADGEPAVVFASWMRR